eukprot:maker-scaffold_2-snap-gene-14.40-mRNA-1 protein AED:0.00 eAED:0.00 QI:214/1/1/1/1/1/2/149/340
MVNMVSTPEDLCSSVQKESLVDEESVSSISLSGSSQRSVFNGEEDPLIKKYLEKLSKDEISSIVSHRGFHYGNDDLGRPLENTLRAFETAWKNGVIICECDVQCTQDGDLVVCHDSSFSRLVGADVPLLSRSSSAEVSQLYLKNGETPVMLEELLEVLSLYPTKKLVIETKEDNTETLLFGLRKVLENKRFVKLFENGQIPLIMSFNYTAMKTLLKLRKEYVVEGGKFPELYLLTKGRDEVVQYVFESSPEKNFDMSNLKNVAYVDKLLDGLDGIYVAFLPALYENEKVVQFLHELKRKYKLGVFYRKFHTESYDQFRKLRNVGFKYVNTDFPSVEKYFG